MRSVAALSLFLLLAVILAAPSSPAQATAAVPAPPAATAMSLPVPPAATPLPAPLAWHQEPASTCLTPAAATMATDPLAARPAGCPLYRACMQFVGGGCSCAGFFCNGQFICGTPIP